MYARYKLSIKHTLLQSSLVNRKSDMIVVAFLTCLLGLACGAPPNVRMIGGDPVENNTSRYQVSIQSIFPGNQQECSGTIISPYWIITAAHCAGLNLVISRVVAGAYNLHKLDNKSAQIRTIDLNNVIKHMDYSDVLNDIALVKMNEPFVFNEDVQPLKISKVPCVVEDEPVQFSGFGVDSTNDSVLFTADMKIVPFEECNEVIHAVYADNLPLKKDIHICVTGTASPCLSDGGGPLVQDEKLVGLLSWLPGLCSQDNIPTIFTNTGYYKKFIETYVEDL